MRFVPSETKIDTSDVGRHLESCTTRCRAIAATACGPRDKLGGVKNLIRSTVVEPSIRRAPGGAGTSGGVHIVGGYAAGTTTPTIPVGTAEAWGATDAAIGTVATASTPHCGRRDLDDQDSSGQHPQRGAARAATTLATGSAATTTAAATAVTAVGQQSAGAFGAAAADPSSLSEVRECTGAAIATAPAGDQRLNDD